jgi:hypothetical protein
MLFESEESRGPEGFLTERMVHPFFFEKIRYGEVGLW